MPRCSGAGQSPNNTNQFNLQDPLVFSITDCLYHLDLRCPDFSGSVVRQRGWQWRGSPTAAVLYRDCLIREAILLHGFIFSTRAR